MAKVKMSTFEYHRLVVGIESIDKNKKELINVLQDLRSKNHIYLNKKIGTYNIDMNIVNENRINEILDDYFNVSQRDRNSKFISDEKIFGPCIVEYTEIIAMINALDDFRAIRIEIMYNLETKINFLIAFFNRNC